MRDKSDQGYKATKILSVCGLILGICAVLGGYFYGSSIGVGTIPSLIAGGIAGGAILCCCCCTGVVASICCEQPNSVSPSQDVELGQYSIPVLPSTNIIGNSFMIPLPETNRPVELNQNYTSTTPITLQSQFNPRGLMVLELGDENGPTPGLYRIEHFQKGSARVDLNKLNKNAGYEIKEAVESNNVEKTWQALRRHQGDGVQLG